MLIRFFFYLFFWGAVSEWDGDSLDISKISRLDMGAYLCIAANGVPPTVSKRIKVSVDCEYKTSFLSIFIDVFACVFIF